MSDYLWDKSGPPDPEVESLERALRPLRYRPRAMTAVRVRRWPVRVLAVAAVLLLSLGLWRGLWVEDGAVAPVPPLAASARLLAGEARLGAGALSGERAFTPGERVETGAGGKVEVQLPQIGTLWLSEESALELLTMRPDQQRFSLARGTLEASVVAPPRLFVVETPSVTAVDLGCAYTITVSPDGSTDLAVRSGYVMLEDASGRESLVPRGARARTRPKQGPGVPYYADVPPALEEAVEALLRGDRSGLPTVYALAQAKDSLTLFHTLWRLSPEDRAAVVDFVSAWEPLSPSARAEVLALDPAGLKRWRRQLSKMW